MQADTQAAPVSKKLLWAGYIVSAVPVLMLLMSAVMKFLMTDDVKKGLSEFGWEERLVLGLGIVEIACTALYVIPRTSILGAILLTGYLGGATATHVRIGGAFFIPIVLGVLVWFGLFLREPRLRALVPLRR